MGGGSVGFQIGIQDSQLVMLIMTEKGLRAVLDSQFKLGADASLAIATVGAGVEGPPRRRSAPTSSPSRRRAACSAACRSKAPDGLAQRREPRLLRPRAGKPADRHRHAGNQPRRRSVARGADPLRRGRREQAASAAAAAGLPASPPAAGAPTQLQSPRRCSSRTCRRRGSRREPRGSSAVAEVAAVCEAIATRCRHRQLCFLLALAGCGQGSGCDS